VLHSISNQTVGLVSGKNTSQADNEKFDEKLEDARQSLADVQRRLKQLGR